MKAGLAAASGLGIHPRRGVEVLDLATELGFVRCGVALGDRAEAGDPVDEVAPDGRDVVPDGADDPQTGDDDTSFVIGLAQETSSFWTIRVQAGTPARVSSRSLDAGSSAAMVSASGAIRRMRPVSTRPGPISTKVVTPASTMCSTARIQSTPAVRC